jgi:branched-chain amino acid transport system ATP-binding protein
MLRVRNLEAGYGALRVLHGVSLHVAEGEIVALIGANGAGKSTLLNTLAGLHRPSGGEIEFQGVTVAGQSAPAMVRRGCVLVPEGRQLFAPLTVEENLLLGGTTRYGWRQRTAQRAALAEIYDRFPVLAERRQQLAGTLSGGEQQMVAIGRALMARPRLIMLDEPSMGLAPLIVRNILQIVVTLRQQRNTVLLVEQNARAALAIADRGYVVETGRITLAASAAELLHHREVQRAYLGKEYRRIDEWGR